MLEDPILLLAAFVAAVAFGRYVQAGYTATTAALANRLRPRQEAPSAAALRLRGLDPADAGEARPGSPAVGASPASA